MVHRMYTPLTLPSRRLTVKSREGLGATSSSPPSGPGPPPPGMNPAPFGAIMKCVIASSTPARPATRTTRGRSAVRTFDTTECAIRSGMNIPGRRIGAAGRLSSFVLPPAQIVPTGEEIWAALKVMGFSHLSTLPLQLTLPPSLGTMISPRRAGWSVRSLPGLLAVAVSMALTAAVRSDGPSPTVAPAYTQTSQQGRTPTAAFTVPVTGPLPDFQPDADWLAKTLHIDHIDGTKDPCLIKEGCVDGPGNRTVLRFDTLVHNNGPGPAHIGEPPASPNSSNIPPWYYYDTCHHHWHFIAYANYQVLNVNGSEVVAQGHKNGFCLMDSLCPPGVANPYDCNDQGIHAQCADLYDAGLGCQWIDITHLPTLPGYSPNTEYLISVILNPEKAIPETDYSNNRAVVKFKISQLAVKATNAWDLPVGADPVSQAAFAAHSRNDPIGSLSRKFGVVNKNGDDLYLMKLHHEERISSLGQLNSGSPTDLDLGGLAGRVGVASRGGGSNGVVRGKRGCQRR
ncbi:hypothetical protein M427DRAFT_36873 [Gonapodya prolifera JEL478]|uniref:Lysyl oxidase n=1 Tax=Gonapodya prolifera (strain JEL478) TaxID=1344416 RepID=A0A139A1J9_GONPJ|nr:hypothetical protein M427DRAFT_36873 [Gonapodya prolifera JEL478]|eukprot:KXS10632.1 hypothetical protein M427DRAFT_36873 [Gonapodya prolifera JEL478]